MSPTTGYLTGCDELIKKLSDLTKTQAKRAISKGCRAGSKIIASAVKRLAPFKSGALQRAIKVRALKRSRVWTGVSVSIGEPIFYGAFLELGTKHGITAEHFMQKAAQENRQAAMGTCLNIIESEIVKFAGGTQ